MNNCSEIGVAWPLRKDDRQAQIEKCKNFRNIILKNNFRNIMLNTFCGTGTLFSCVEPRSVRTKASERPTQSD